jgi:hypothetical protein
MSTAEIWIFAITLSAWFYFIGYKAGKERGWKDTNKAKPDAGKGE